jgi:hypothetical protein
MKECTLLGGLLSYSIQLFLGIAAILTLVYKRHIERPQRAWKVWSLDVGKQLLGGFCVHFANIIVSSILGNNGDECAWYFINFFIDCTFGVGVVYVVHEGICRITRRSFGPSSSLSSIGHYGEPPNLKVWSKQMGVYLVSLLVNKLIVCGLLYLNLNSMESFGNWLFGPLQSNRNLELIIVMVVCPFLLTSFQFLIFDAILKAPSNKDCEGSSQGIAEYSALHLPKLSESSSQVP